MKKNIPLALMLICNLAGAAQYCDAWEYARMKDSRAEELVEHACATKKNIRANLKEGMAMLADMRVPLQEAERIKQIQSVCVAQLKEAKTVYLRKFGKELDDDCGLPTE